MCNVPFLCVFVCVCIQKSLDDHLLFCKCVLPQPRTLARVTTKIPHKFKFLLWLQSVIFYPHPFCFLTKIISSLCISSVEFSFLVSLTLSKLFSKFAFPFLISLWTSLSEFPCIRVHVTQFGRHAVCIGIWFKISCYCIPYFVLVFFHIILLFLLLRFM